MQLFQVYIDGGGCCSKNNTASKKHSDIPSVDPQSSILFSARLTTFLKVVMVICPLLPVSCNLFNAPLQDYYFDKIDEEIAWANAEKIKADVVTQENTWQARWPDKFGEIRKGYEFTVEFISSSDMLLDEWIALEGTVNILGKTAA